MTESSFGIYIVHYIVVLSVCSYLKFRTSLPVIAIYVIAVLAVVIISPVLYEIIRRIPVLRYLVLGIRKTK